MHATLAAFALVVILTGCKDSPTEPAPYRISCEQGCTELTPVPLTADETRYWMRLAREEVQAQADSGAIRLSRPLASIPDPSVEWRPCPWSCGDCYDLPGGGTSPGFDGCAAGLTKTDGTRIYVSTWDRARRGPLVAWEMRNSLWIRSGNGELAQKTAVIHSER